MGTVTSWFGRITGTGLKLDNMKDLLLAQLEDLHSAEEQLIEALPKMAKAASSAQLKAGFNEHLAETKQQKQRVERCFKMLGSEVRTETCQAMKGLIEEGGHVIDAQGDPDVKDAALIAAAQRVEHYEMAAYGCARAFAQRLGHHDIADLLQQTLDEERATDEKLTDLAEHWVNAQAAHT